MDSEPKHVSNLSQDELVWGAAWLYKATGENGYLQYLIRNGNALGGTRVTVKSFSWDNKYAGAQVLLAQVRLMSAVSLQKPTFLHFLTQDLQVLFTLD